MILPLRVRGTVSANSISFGATTAPRCTRACASSSRSSSCDHSKPGFRVTKAFTTSPATGSGLPMTPASATAGCSSSTLSTSNGPIRWPEVLITSSPRPTNQKYPSASRRARSPVRYQPSRKHFAYRSGSPRYARNIDGQPGRNAISPSAPGSSTRSTPPSARRWTSAASTPGNGRPIEPGRISSAGKFAIMIAPVSVCHQLSWKGSPNASSPQTTPSGFSGSPTLARKRRAGKSCARTSSTPAFIIIRIAVGAVYQTDTCCSSRIRYQRSASNSASSTMLVTPFASGATMP